MTGQLPARTPAGDAPALYRPRVVTAVCDPRAPAAFRRWARRQRPCLDARGNLVALTPGGSSRGTRPAAAGGWLLAVGCLVMMFVDPLSAGWGAWLAAALAAAISGATVQIRSGRPDLELAKTTVVFPENLDDPCRALLGRAQSAISIVLGSRVRSAGLLGHPVDDALLGEREWEIASQLREITTLRTLYQANTAGSPAGPMTSDVLGRQRRAIELAQEGTTSLVLALERYASQIAAADEAGRDWQRATELSELNDKYLDLVARTAADDFATEEIAGMTEQLAAATRTRSDRLHDADLAARALELP